MCIHLIDLDNYIKDKGIKEIFRGKAWSKNCNEWVYYDCIIDIEKIKGEIIMDNCITIHEYNDIKIANELGFFVMIVKMALWDLVPIMNNQKIKLYWNKNMELLNLFENIINVVNEISKSM
jgi:hypothetical protein